MPTDQLEQLNETLLELKRSKERETKLAEENRVILATLSAISRAENKQQIFDELKRGLGRYIDFDDFVVLSRENIESSFKTYLSSNEMLFDKIWPNGRKFQRVLGGECILLFEPMALEEFDRIPNRLSPKIHNALLTGIKTQTSESVLLLLGSRKGQFDIKTKKILLRFRPLLERAISDIEHKEKLEKLVELKTNELVEAQEVAAKANQAKSKFLAMMSHELRTPLNAVLGITELLQTETGTSQKQLLERMENSAELLHVIISDILDFSRIESGHFNLRRHWTNLHDKLTYSFEYHQKLAREKGLNFRVNTDIEKNLEYFVDPVRILQIIFNLVGNAIKFTEAGEITIDIYTLENALIISVSDTGIGIVESELAHLFTPFIQADSSITRNYGGTGLGLTITKTLVDLMGGKIKVDTEPNKGTTFSITLPLVVKLAPTTNQIKPTLSSDNEPLNVDCKHILLVEDTTTNQMIIKLMLSRIGYIVTIANNGVEAVDLVQRQNEFDIVLMDISMPCMDGIQATRLMRQNNFTKPIIALTAHTLNENRQACLDAGMDDMIIKPIKSTSIQKILSKYI
ncbi:ATP-binding protein [Vibrio sp. WJH972]